MTSRAPRRMSRRQFGAATFAGIGAVIPAIATAQPYPDGLLIYDGEEFLELATYASLQPSGRLVMAFGTVDEIPAVDRVPMLICNLGGLWSVGSMWFTTRRVFDDGGADRQRLAFAINRMSMRTTRLRIKALEDANTLRDLMTRVKAGPDNPAYAVFAVSNRAVVRHYLVQMRAPED